MRSVWEKLRPSKYSNITLDNTQWGKAFQISCNATAFKELYQSFSRDRTVGRSLSNIITVTKDLRMKINRYMFILHNIYIHYGPNTESAHCTLIITQG